MTGTSQAKSVGSGLRHRGYDVRAVDEEQALEGLGDPDLLDLATQDGRVLVTCNVRDFSPLLVEWASDGRDHAGVLLVPSSILHHELGVIVNGVQGALAGTAQAGRRNRVAWVRRGEHPLRVSRQAQCMESQARRRRGKVLSGARRAPSTAAVASIRARRGESDAAG